MSRYAAVVVAVLLAVGGYFFNQRYEIEGLKNLTLKPREGATDAGNGGGTSMSPVGGPRRAGETIRICSFNIQVFGQSKLAKPEVMEILARTIREFDVIAVQEIRSSAQDVMPRFMDLINATGRKYEFVIGPRLGNTVSKEQYAFVYDSETIQTDVSALYTLSDPDNLLHREPLVGWFRALGPSADQAFTFSLINIHTDPDDVAEEVDVLDDAFRAVMNDDRNEDDVILLGDLNADPAHFGQLGEVSGITPLIHAPQKTNTRGSKLYDNLVLRLESTPEFTGRAGVKDLLRDYNLSMEQAIDVSDHLPVWGEFSIYEGGRSATVATRPETPPR